MNLKGVHQPYGCWWNWSWQLPQELPHRLCRPKMMIMMFNVMIMMLLLTIMMTMTMMIMIGLGNCPRSCFTACVISMMTTMMLMMISMEMKSPFLKEFPKYHPNYDYYVHHIDHNLMSSMILIVSIFFSSKPPTLLQLLHNFDQDLIVVTQIKISSIMIIMFIIPITISMNINILLQRAVNFASTTSCTYTYISRPILGVGS